MIRCVLLISLLALASSSSPDASRAPASTSRPAPIPPAETERTCLSDPDDVPFGVDLFAALREDGEALPGSRVRRHAFRLRPSAQQAVAEALRWLADHQDPDGRWDSDGFDRHCPPGAKCTGPGGPLHAVGLTGLALLAFVDHDSIRSEGPSRDVVRRGLRWLIRQQDECGLIGVAAGTKYSISHLIATYALCEWFAFTRYTPLRNNAQRAVDWLQKARNPDGVWRYHPRDGDNDSSVTGWAVLALASAKASEHLGLAVDQEAIRASIAWYDALTDPDTGRVGYTQRGSPLARPRHLVDRFPASKSESLTAVALLARFLAGQDPREHPVMFQHADLLAKTPPLWAADGSIDMYYWFYGSHALYRMGGRYWKDWSARMEKAVVGSQVRGSGHDRGSWDPVGVWGEEGGRVYSTAILVLCLQGNIYYSFGSRPR